MAIYSGFSHWKWWFSIAILVYQRVTPKKTNQMWVSYGFILLLVGGWYALFTETFFGHRPAGCKKPATRAPNLEESEAIALQLHLSPGCWQEEHNKIWQQLSVFRPQIQARRRERKHGRPELDSFFMWDYSIQYSQAPELGQFHRANLNIWQYIVAHGSVQKQGTPKSSGQFGLSRRAAWQNLGDLVTDLLDCTAIYPRTTLPLYQILAGYDFDMYGIHNPTQSLWSTQVWYSCIPDWSVVVAFSDSSAIRDSSLSTLLHIIYICPCSSFQGESKQVLVLHPLASSEYWRDVQLYPHRYYIMICYIKLYPPELFPLYPLHIHYISTIDISKYI